MVELECLRNSRSQAQRPVGDDFRWEGGAGAWRVLGKDEGQDRSADGAICCADSRKDPSMAGRVICVVSDLRAGWGEAGQAAVLAVGCRGERGDAEVEPRVQVMWPRSQVTVLWGYRWVGQAQMEG